MIIILSSVIHIARKQHHCDQCGQPIEPGTRYQRIRGIWDGTPGGMRHHEDCAAAVVQLHKAMGLRWDEGIWLSEEISPTDHAWMWAEFPGVAERLGLPRPAEVAACSS